MKPSPPPVIYISDKNYLALEEYLDLLILTFAIAKYARMLPSVLHQKNPWLKYSKWPHWDQIRW
jgi:hypothetical protein